MKRVNLKDSELEAIVNFAPENLREELRAILNKLSSKEVNEFVPIVTTAALAEWLEQMGVSVPVVELSEN